MPLELVFVRHGESEGNLALSRARAGDESSFHQDFIARHSSHWRLSDKGLYQAESAGEWLNKHFPDGFDRAFCSDYERAKETAAHLGYPEMPWYCDFNLRERDWGVLDTMPLSQRREKYSEVLATRDKDPFYWRPPQGESLAQLALRLNRVLETLHRECFDKRVIIVCHGEVMHTMRVLLERMTQARFREIHTSKNNYDHIYNCQIIHYTRRIPETKELTPYLHSMRSICPWDESLSSNSWNKIVRPKFVAKDLLEQVETWPRMIHD